MTRFFITIALLISPCAHAEKFFVYCSEASPSTFNPQIADDGPTFNASSVMLYNRLVEFDPGTTKVVPGLAETWEISKDGRAYTFHLRPNVAFHETAYFKPTRTMNADDVIFSFERALKRDHPYHGVGGGNYIFFSGMNLDKLIVSITKIDDRTVRFNLTRPESPFLADLAMHFAVVLSAEYADQLAKAKTKDKIDVEPIGTGPWQLKRYVKDNTIRYDAHAKYWRGRSPLDHFVFAITPDASVRVQKLKAGECNLIAEPPPQDLAGIETHPKLKLMREPGANVGYVAFNTKKAPFDNRDVRRAINMALNRVAYLDVIYRGTAMLATNALPPNVWGANGSIKPTKFDTVGAKALLRKAGYPDGFDTELWTLPVSRPYNPNGKKMGELMQADLAKIGVRVKILTYDWPTYLAKARHGDHQMMQFGWSSDNGDPDNFLSTLLSCSAVLNGGNTARWCDHEYDALVIKARAVTDLKTRTDLYFKAEEIFARELPWVPVAHATVFRGMSRNVEGYRINPLGTEEFYPIDLK
jgi:dipeptide transport system substrate-binding protein